MKPKLLAVLVALSVAFPAFAAVGLDGSTEYLESSTAAFTADPYSWSVFFNKSGSAAVGVLVAVSDTDSVNDFVNMNAQVSTAFVRHQMRASGVTGNADTSTNYSTSTWHVASGHGATSTDRSAYLDGAGKASNATMLSPLGIDNTTVGVLKRTSTSSPFDGKLAFFAVWSAAITDAEHASLGAGADPRLVRPQSLVSMWPLLRGGDYIDIIGANNLSAVGTPTDEDNPPVFLWY